MRDVRFTRLFFFQLNKYERYEKQNKETLKIVDGLKFWFHIFLKKFKCLIFTTFLVNSF